MEEARELRRRIRRRNIHGVPGNHDKDWTLRVYNDWNRSMQILRYDVGGDANGYAPVSLNEILCFFEGVEYRRRVTCEQWAALGPPEKR